MIWVALCSMTMRNTRKLVSEMVLDPPISFTSSRSHSIVSNILSIRVESSLTSRCSLLYLSSAYLTLTSKLSSLSSIWWMYFSLSVSSGFSLLESNSSLSLPTSCYNSSISLLCKFTNLNIWKFLYSFSLKILNSSSKFYISVAASIFAKSSRNFWIFYICYDDFFVCLKLNNVLLCLCLAEDWLVGVVKVVAG